MVKEILISRIELVRICPEQYSPLRHSWNGSMKDAVSRSLQGRRQRTLITDTRQRCSARPDVISAFVNARSLGSRLRLSSMDRWIDCSSPRKCVDRGAFVFRPLLSRYFANSFD